jgi:mono/diheme cytochrome c family protein
VWIPHIVNQSGASQVFLRGAEMGPLNDSLVHMGYNRPELFKVYLDESGPVRQGAVASAVKGFPCALLHGVVNPADGQLYVCGFRIWGTALDQISGLFRVRYTGGVSTVPEEIRSEERGILLRFGFELDEVIATSPASYTVERWNYERTKNYGSGHYRPGGEPGQDVMPVARVVLSEDGKAVFLGIPNMAPVHTMSVRYRVARASDLPKVQSAYLTVHQLNGFDLREAGFGLDEVDLEIDPATLAAAKKAPKPSVEHGKEVAAMIGCVACHSVDGSMINAQPGQVVGPTWQGLWGTKRELSDGTVVKSVDATYLRESILEPGAKMAKGFENMGVGMPSYLGILQDWQVESVILYIESLGARKGKKAK